MGVNRELPLLLSEIGQRVQFRREVAGLTVSALAAKSRVNRSTIAQLEKGRRNATIQVLWQLAEAVGVDIQIFFPRPRRDMRGMQFSESPYGRSEK